MADVVFGPEWPSRLGNEIWSLAHDLPAESAARLRETALLPPNDPRWGINVNDQDALFTRVGVFDGLRLQSAREFRFAMSMRHGIWHMERRIFLKTATSFPN